MKKIALFLLCMTLFISCKNASEETSTIPEVAANAEIETVPVMESPTTRNSYGNLFSGDSSLCPLLSPAEVASALSIPETNVQTVEGLPCVYQVTMSDGSVSSMTVSPGKATNEIVNQEISNYKSDTTGLLTATLSTTGDVYLCAHKPNSKLFLYHPESDNYVAIGTSSRAMKGTTLTPKSVRSDNAKLLANALLEKYKS